MAANVILREEERVRSMLFRSKVCPCHLTRLCKNAILAGSIYPPPAPCLLTLSHFLVPSPRSHPHFAVCFLQPKKGGKRVVDMGDETAPGGAEAVAAEPVPEAGTLGVFYPVCILKALRRALHSLYLLPSARLAFSFTAELLCRTSACSAGCCQA